MKRKRRLRPRQSFLVGYDASDVNRELERMRHLNHSVQTATEEERRSFANMYMEKWALQDELRRLLDAAIAEEQHWLKVRDLP